MTTSKIPVGGYVKITDKKLLTFSQIGKVRRILGVYDVIIPNQETPIFLKNIHEKDIIEFMGYDILQIEDEECNSRIFGGEEILPFDEIKCSIKKKNSSIFDCILKKVGVAYEIAPENFSSMKNYGGVVFFSDTQTLKEEQFEYLNKTVFDKDFREELKKKRERKRKIQKFLFFLPFVTSLYLKNKTLNPQKLEKVKLEVLEAKKKELEIINFLES